MSLRLENRVALVTGGTGVLGRAVVRRLQTAGAAVHATWFTKGEVERLATYLGDAAAKVTLYEADVESEKGVRDLFARLERATGQLDILVNVVGGFAMAPLEETTVDVWDKMLRLNATSAFLCARAALPLMRRYHRGRIVNVAALPPLNRGTPRMSAYGAAKAAVLNLTETLAKELATERITVNAIVPSTIDTPQNRKAMPEADTSTWLDPDAIAEVIGFLVSDGAAIVTGTAVMLSKGAES